MKALSVQQPWAWLIVHGYKDIENRKWYTVFRGDVLIHAGKTIDVGAYARLRALHPEIPLPPLEALEKQTGGIVGKTRVTDCVKSSESEWFFGPHGFVLDTEHSSPLPFRPLRGQLYFFEVGGEQR
jgi:hypothetical protein